MKKFPVGTIAFIGVLLFIIIAGIASYVSAANYGNATEASLRAAIKNNENIYANGTQKIVEIAQVPAMYVDDVRKVTEAAIVGRYGDQGSQAVFQMLREQNPQLDASLYKAIQQEIRAFRDQFQNGQTAMLDRKRAYETALGTVWTGTWLRFAGYPKLDLAQYDIVTTDKAAETFRTKRDTGIQLRPAQ